MIKVENAGVLAVLAVVVLNLVIYAGGLAAAVWITVSVLQSMGVL